MVSNNIYQDKKGSYDINEVTIRTVDQALTDYFDKVIQIHVDSNDRAERRKVPVIFATGERWNLIRDKKGLRDDNDTLILPLITIQRMNIDRTPGFGGMAQETRQINVSRRIHPKTANLKNRLESRRKNKFPQVRKDKVIYEYMTLPFPDFATFHYQIMIWAQYMSQMNEILEKLFYEYDWFDSFVMPVEYSETQGSDKTKSYYFVGFREGDLVSQSNFEEFTDDERIIRYSYDVKIPVYLILDPESNELSYGRDEEGKSKVYKDQSITEIKFNNESTMLLSEEEFEEEFGS